MKAKELDIPEDIVDEIVDEIVSETKPEIKSREELPTGMLETANFKVRLQNLENRIEKHMHDYKTTAIEAERQISIKADEIEQQYQKQLMYLQSQVEALRTAMIRLGSEFRQFKEGISSQKR